LDHNVVKRPGLQGELCALRTAPTLARPLTLLKRITLSSAIRLTSSYGASSFGKLM
jgi:hypothetical protein